MKRNRLRSPSRFRGVSHLLGLATALAWLAACDIVMSTHPVGTEPVKLVAEEWQGTWVNDDGAITAVVPEGPPGRLQLAWIEVKEEPVLETSVFHVRAAGDWLFGSFVDDETPGETRYIWGRLVKDEGTVLFWLPREEGIRELVEAGLLPGEVDEDGDVLLGKLEPEHLAVLTSEDHGILFEWDDPMILRRLGG